MSELTKDEFMNLTDDERETYIRQQIKTVGLKNISFLSYFRDYPDTPAYIALVKRVTTAVTGGSLKRKHISIKKTRKRRTNKK